MTGKTRDRERGINIGKYVSQIERYKETEVCRERE